MVDGKNLQRHQCASERLMQRGNGLLGSGSQRLARPREVAREHSSCIVWPLNHKFKAVLAPHPVVSLVSLTCRLSYSRPSPSTLA